MSQRIYIINPNSSTLVTAGIEAALAPLRLADGPELCCVTLADGPAGIQTQSDVDHAALSVQRFALAHRHEAAAFVVACFSDPGLQLLREIPDVLSFGISECGVLTALTLGQSFGVIAILNSSIPRHGRTWGAMGVTSRFAGELAIGRCVSDLSNEAATLDAMVQAGRRLRDDKGAQVLVMGCAGMASQRTALQEAVGLLVVEPTQAAVAMAIGRVRLGW